MSQDLEAQATGLLTSAQKGGTRDYLATGWQNELHVSELLPRYSRLNELGVIYSTGMVLTSISNATFTQATGLSVTLGTAATGTPIVGVWNPATSGVNLHILYASLGLVITAATATGCGGFVWGTFAGQSAITVASQATPVNGRTGVAAGSLAKGLSGLALTGLSLVGVFNRASGLNGGQAGNFSEVGTAVGFAPTAACGYEDLSGSFIVPPGGILALFCGTTPVAHSATASITWAEMPA